MARKPRTPKPPKPKGTLVTELPKGKDLTLEEKWAPILNTEQLPVKDDLPKKTTAVVLTQDVPDPSYKLAEVCQVAEVQNHPNPEKAHLGVFILNTGAQLIGVNNADGSRRFKVGDLLVHVKPDSIIPEKIINSGFENVKGGKIKASKFSDVMSEGIMLNLFSDVKFGGYYVPHTLSVSGLNSAVALGDDVTKILGITK